MAVTYEPLASTTLNTSAVEISLSSIASGWTDLLIRCVAPGTTDTNPGLRLNGDTGANYSCTVLDGRGTTAASSRQSSNSVIGIIGDYVANTTSPTVLEASVQSYANTSIHKTVLWSFSAPTVGVTRGVGLWRSTSAVTSLTLRAFGVSWPSGTVVSIYGIKAA